MVKALAEQIIKRLKVFDGPFDDLITRTNTWSLKKMTRCGGGPIPARNPRNGYRRPIPQAGEVCDAFYGVHYTILEGRKVKRKARMSSGASPLGKAPKELTPLEYYQALERQELNLY